MDRLGWGIIGCGDVVLRKSGPSILKSERSTLVAVMRRDAAKAKAAAAHLRAAAWTANVAEIIENPEVNVLYVATPPDTHLEYARAAARAGKPVLVEKPMALSAAQGEAMIAACERSGTPLFVAYYRRFHPHIQAMRRLILEGRIGKPVHAVIDLAFPAPPPEKAGWRVQPEISGGGHFVDVGSHRLDVMAFLLGELEEARGLQTTFDAGCRVEQMVSVCARFRSGPFDVAQGRREHGRIGGALLTAMGDYYSGRRVDRFAVFGTEGAIVAESFDSHAFRLETRAGAEDLRFEPFPAPHLGLIRHIEDVLLDGKPNETSGRHALATERMLDACCAGRAHG